MSVYRGTRRDRDIAPYLQNRLAGRSPSRPLPSQGKRGGVPAVPDSDRFRMSKSYPLESFQTGTTLQRRGKRQSVRSVTVFLYRLRGFGKRKVVGAASSVRSPICADGSVSVAQFETGWSLPKDRALRGKSRRDMWAVKQRIIEFTEPG